MHRPQKRHGLFNNPCLFAFIVTILKGLIKSFGKDKLNPDSVLRYAER